MKKRKVVSFLLSALLVTLIFASIPQTTNHHEAISRGAEQNDTERTLRNLIVKRTGAWDDHGPIKIDGNQEFKETAEAESWEGNGPVSYPYIIENYFIDRDGDDGNCIQISNTDVHFIIRDSNLTRAYATGRAAIWLENVTNGVISNNSIAESYNGIYLEGGHILVENNEIDATSQASGIVTLTLNNSIITGNTVNAGTWGYHLWETFLCEITNNTITDCLTHGLYTYSSHDTIISENVIENTGTYGISIDYCDNMTLSRNNCTNNYYGIYLSHSSNCTVSNCTMNSNDQGITVISASYNYFEFCLITDSVERAIWFGSSSLYNVFNWNIMKNSGIIHVHFYDVLNVVEYNYYDNYAGPDFNGDGFGDTPHPHFSLTDEVYDYHPLVHEPSYPTWDPAPEDQYMEYGESLIYDLDVTSSIPITGWQISDEASFIISDMGTISNKEPLEVGTYPLIVTVTNAYEMSVEASFSVQVDDTVNPTWVSQVKNKTYDYGESIEFQMTAWDLSGIGHWTISDTDHFALSESSYADTSIALIEGISLLASGVYPLSITVYDNHDNTANAQFYVIVGEEEIDTTNPTWIVLPHDISIEEGEDFYLQVGAWDASGIASWNLTGSSSFVIDENGVITNDGVLAVGTYDLEVKAYDPNGNYCSAEFRVTVVKAPGDGTDTSTTPTQPVEIGDFGFLISTAGIAIAVVALIMGIGALLNTRKGS